YADQPLVATPTGQKVIDSRLGLDLLASVGLFHRLLVWADLPIVPRQSGTLAPIGGMSQPGDGVGDLRLGVKALLGSVDAGGGATVGFALGGFASLPTGDQDKLTGAGAYGQIGPTAEVRVGGVSAAVSVAAVLRQDQFVWNTSLEVGSQL